MSESIQQQATEIDPKLARLRKEYSLKSFSETDADPDPIRQFEKWWAEAVNSEIIEVNAMTLATCDNEGKPSARIVLLKSFNKNGFIFFSNYESRKGKELEANPFACLVFFWKELERQVRIEGVVQKINDRASDEYFLLRPQQSRIGAWSSPQSQVIENREYLEKNVVHYQQKFPDGNIPRPPHWGGYLLKYSSIEFWQGRRNRLHDRLLYIPSTKDNWQIKRLAP